MNLDANLVLSLFDLTPEAAVLVCDDSGIIKCGNSNAAELLKRNVQQLAGLQFLDLCQFSGCDVSGQASSAQSFRDFARSAQVATIVQLAKLPASQIFVQVRELGDQPSIFAIVLRSGAIRSTVVPDMLMSVAEEVSHFGTFSWDMAADQLEWSDGLLRIFDIDRSSFTGKGEAFFTRVHPDDQALLRESISRAIRSCSSCASRRSPPERVAKAESRRLEAD